MSALAPFFIASLFILFWAVIFLLLMILKDNEIQYYKNLYYDELEKRRKERKKQADKLSSKIKVTTKRIEKLRMDRSKMSSNKELRKRDN